MKKTAFSLKTYLYAMKKGEKRMVQECSETETEKSRSKWHINYLNLMKTGLCHICVSGPLIFHFMLYVWHNEPSNQCSYLNP